MAGFERQGGSCLKLGKVKRDEIPWEKLKKNRMTTGLPSQESLR